MVAAKKHSSPSKPDEPGQKAQKSRGKTAPEKSKRSFVDWDAIRRDFRTGKFTDGELSDKHGVSREAIVRRRKREPENWPQDVSQAVREATNAALVREMITTEITDGHKKITDTVLAAAELNKQVILKHRSDIEETRKVAADLLAEVSGAKLLASEQELLAQILAGSCAEPKDEAQARSLVRKALDFGNRVASVKALAETFTKLQAAERTAFRLDDDQDDDSSDKPRLTDAERAVRLAAALSKVQ